MLMPLGRPIEILLVEDNEGDARLAKEALKDAKVANNITWVKDGVEALTFLHNEGDYEGTPNPDVILLDLNLPKKDGRQVLASTLGGPAWASGPDTDNRVACVATAAFRA